MSTGDKTSGGEGGIRTLDTGVSPYNGLANSTRPLPIARNQSVTITAGALSRAESVYSAKVYAPEYAPPRTENPLRAYPGEFVTHATSAAVRVASLVSTQSSSPTVPSGQEGRPVVRYPQQLRLHAALEEIGWAGTIGGFNDAARLKESSVPDDPVLITTNGTILAGFGRWRAALFDDRREINCIEYSFNEDESLQFILTHHQIRSGWNDFVRICLALTLETTLQKNALENMRAGGKSKGLASLPEAGRIDVRKEIARAAGVGDRNVSNVRTILQTAHPILVSRL